MDKVNTIEPFESQQQLCAHAAGKSDFRLGLQLSHFLTAGEKVKFLTEAGFSLQVLLLVWKFHTWV
jgi:hypothetical protein